MESAPSTRPRVVSMVPAGTEIVAALDRTETLAAVSHDCDWPPAIHGAPSITRCEIDGADLSSADVDAWVARTLQDRGSLYTIDESLLRRLAPGVILTQRLCDVCAPAYGSVAALAATLATPPRLVNLEPESLDGILADIATVAEALDDSEAGERLIASLQRRIDAVRDRTADLDDARRPRVLVVEWIDPIFSSGHWGPELVHLAGGFETIGTPGRPSTQVAWDRVREARPDVLVLACCGLSVERTLSEVPRLAERDGWGDLPAVRNGRVWAIDGSAYLSRPGPRIVDGLEILAGIFHPGRFPDHRAERWPVGHVQRLAGSNPVERG